MVHELEKLRALCSGENVTVGQLIDQLAARGNAFIAMFFCLPFLLPIPLPGVSQVIGPLIALAGIQMARHRHLNLPVRWRAKSLPSNGLRELFKSFYKVMNIIGKVVRPRWPRSCRPAVVDRFVGIAIAICAMLLTLPYPPGTNFPPACAIMLLTIGYLERDFVLVLAGFVSTLLNILLFGLITYMGVEGIRLLVGM